jgi:hypothetical protein
MHESAGWYLDARTAWIFLVAWGAAVLLHGLWRSMGEAEQDPIRESGPVL